MKCPRCKEAELETDWVDIDGVGAMPSGPYGCPNCGWVEGRWQKHVIVRHNDGTSTTINEAVDKMHTVRHLPAGFDYLELRGVSTGTYHTFRLTDVKSVTVHNWEEIAVA